ncbi:Ferric reductase transmembrane component 3 [Fulvia fulva]|uniref:ferric-chelate reductase (NADPH) n=1 Tax=Passalora fulva TaxID=5499 RepID=A0A9Q8L902_PASFU|nr:Ferric reductase transmembrane component 3 [Fulvia fulva]KAK4636285.1 Ferric reductase transmembrane component 3 [Fulvia fulva]KAK4636405.1 Ferric reductase transmembrane component 3 [Fulvia fulva]UJO13024.1 Ferric reductase transmembrane component 3 [Fulvia fulva]WPV08884.1 Ferric reductase transmembrane component 3 [Fulvia fulva]WPV25287.1 Ferric reductase transmembrane component 3 [Fulvia fulva]
MHSWTWVLLAAAMPYARAERDDTAEKAAALLNDKTVKYIGWTWGMIIAIVLIYRWTLHLLQHIRKLANLYHGTSSDGRQRYFSIPDDRWAKFKRHWLSAPLLSKRHNREFKLSAAMNVGTLPGRMQTFFLLGYFALNVVFTVWKIDWTSKGFMSAGLSRTGILATINMVPLFLLAGRNNPLISLLGISFNDFNMIHRWIGRIVVFEAVAHASFWFCGKVAKLGSEKGLQAIANSMANSTFILSGTIGFCTFCALLLQSPSIIRHAFYETFLHLHIALAITAVVAVWMHLDGMPAQLMLFGALVCWIFERLVRVWLIVTNNFGRKGRTKAEVEALPGDSMRVTLRPSKTWKFRPGQHVYLYIPSIGMWTSHPFSLAWSEDGTDLANEKALPMARQDILAAKATSISLIIRRRTGFTDTLYKKAEQCKSGPLTTTAYVEGPYGHESFQSYGTVMLFAAGVGITHQVPHVRDLVAAYNKGTGATRKVVLVWVIQSPEHLEWIRPWMTQILGMEKRRDILKILLFVTRPRSTKEIQSPSASVQMFPGKPDVGALIGKEQEKQVGAMAISVCGTGSLSDDVRRGMRDRCEQTEIDFFEEAFSW